MSNEQGELKKRLLDVRFRFMEDASGVPLKEVSAGCEIITILDEAAKAFPVKIDEKLIQTCKKYLNPPEGTLQRITLTSEQWARFILWYAKWFGEQK